MASAFTQFLNTNLLPRFANEAQACRLTHANVDNWVDNTAVAQVIDFPLDPNSLKQTNYKFPLLSVYTEEEHFHQWTLVYTATRRDIVLAWILPPLAPEQMNRLYPFLGIASKTWLAYGPQGYDPKVTPQGPSFWTNSNLSFGAMLGVKYLPYMGLDKEKKSAYFPSIQMRISFVEKNQYPVAQNYTIPFSGAYIEEDLYDGYNPGNPILNFVDGYVYPSITMTSCSPNSGTIQGYTQLTIVGTGFLTNKNPTITICGVPAASVIVTSPTVLTVITNPGITVGTGDIEYNDAQQSTATITSGFTYTSP